MTRFTAWAVLTFLALSMPLAWAEGSAVANGPQIQEKIKLLLEPVRGLNSELEVGLQKIEQTCAIISKSKLNETQLLLAGSEQVNQQKLALDLSSAKEILIDLRRQVQIHVGLKKDYLAATEKKCAVASALNTDICKTQKSQTEILNKVAEASDYYYQEAFKRIKTYEKSQELENQGCTRPGFSSRLWMSEKTHLMPTLKTSAETFMGLMN